MRASSGKAGVHEGRTKETTSTKMMYRPTSSRPGTSAPAYMSPTERPIWSASTISTNEGGMACAKVPEAVMVPVAMVRL
jgi:hypothetical protein